MKLDKFNSFILERRISQISSNIEITYGFDIIKTKHSEERSDLSTRGLGYNHHISNEAITKFIDMFKQDISESIASGEISNETAFVIRSESQNLSMAIVAEEVTPKYWKLIITTIFPESEDNKFRTGYKQLVFNK